MNDPSTSTAPAVTAEADDDAGSTADVLERCADVAQITTDVVSNNAQSATDPVFRGVVATYAEEHADTFGGMWTDRVANGTFVLAFTDDPAAHLAALAERSPSPDDVHVEEPHPKSPTIVRSVSGTWRSMSCRSNTPKPNWSLRSGLSSPPSER